MTDLTIRNLMSSDLDAAAKILHSAFGPQGDRRAELALYLSIQPGGWWLAELDGVPAGMVGSMEYGPFAYVGLMAVHQSAQRRGVGHALLRHLIEDLDARGCPMAVLNATETGAPLYFQVGFVVDDQTLTFEQTEDAPVSGTSSRDREVRARSFRTDDLVAVADFDEPLFGAPRQRVLAAYLEHFPGRAFVIEDESGRIAGYLFAQPRKLGPWVARNAQDAEALLQTALALSFDGPVTVLAPGANAGESEMLARYGFRLVRSLRYMRCGGAPMRGGRTQVYGLASFGIG